MAKSFPVPMIKTAGMFVVQGGQPIDDGDLKFVGQKGDGLAMLPDVQKFCPNAALVIPQFWKYQYLSLDGITDFWEISGIITIDGKQYELLEYSGELADRATAPNPFIDKNPDTTVGGPNLKYRIVEEPMDGYLGEAEVYWGK